jgi:hypothetical protein
LTSERTKQADARHQDNGRIVGQLPYGWRRDAERSTLMVADWDEQCTLAEMVRLAGENGSDASSRQVAKTLNRLGYKSRSGKPWHHEAVRRILRRPRFAQPDQ